MVQRALARPNVGGAGAQYEKVDGKYVAKRTTHVTDEQLGEYRRKAIAAMQQDKLHVSGRDGVSRTAHVPGLSSS